MLPQVTTPPPPSSPSRIHAHTITALATDRHPFGHFSLFTSIISFSTTLHCPITQLSYHTIDLLSLTTPPGPLVRSRANAPEKGNRQRGVGAGLGKKGAAPGSKLVGGTNQIQFSKTH